MKQYVHLRPDFPAHSGTSVFVFGLVPVTLLFSKYSHIISEFSDGNLPLVYTQISQELPALMQRNIFSIEKCVFSTMQKINLFTLVK